jgi:hypothetical protein
MTTKIIVIVEDQDACAGPRLAIEMSRRQSAYAATHDNQVVFLLR